MQKSYSNHRYDTTHSMALSLGRTEITLAYFLCARFSFFCPKLKRIILDLYKKQE
jgi:hypothetical protein